MPAEMSQVLAWGIDLPAYRGKVYHLNEPDQEMKAKYEGWLKRTAMEECISASEALSDKDQRINREIVLSDLALRKYRWGGPKWADAVKTEAGMTKLISFLLRDSKKREIDQDVLQEMLNDTHPICPWLMGAFYMAIGMDPTTALTAGNLTVAEAKKASSQEQEIVNQIMRLSQSSSLPTSQASGLSIVS